MHHISMEMLPNTSYYNKHYILRCPQYSNYICGIFRDKIKRNFSYSMIMIRITYINTIYIDIYINTFQNTILSICANLYQKRGTIF